MTAGMGVYVPMVEYVYHLLVMENVIMLRIVGKDVDAKTGNVFPVVNMIAFTRATNAKLYLGVIVLGINVQKPEEIVKENALRHMTVVKVVGVIMENVIHVHGLIAMMMGNVIAFLGVSATVLLIV